MNKTFSVKRFNSNVGKHENKYGMGKEEKKTFRAVMLYKCLIRENSMKKGN